MQKLITTCPCCSEELTITSLACKNCGIEIKGAFFIEKIYNLTPEQQEFLEVFLRSRGSLNKIQEHYGMTYLLAKKRLDEILSEMYDISINTSTLEALADTNYSADNELSFSRIIRNKLINEGGQVRITSLNNKFFSLIITEDGNSFISDGLPEAFEFIIFDYIGELLEIKGGRANKGNGRNFKLGEGGCGFDTIVGTIGAKYFGKDVGQSVYDPVFVLAAILEWANICNNRRGYIEYSQEYREKLSSNVLVINKDLLIEFEEDLRNNYNEAEEILGYRSPGLVNLIEEKGAYNAAKELINDASVAGGISGLNALQEAGRLDLSIESLASSKKYKSLFSDEIIAQCKQTLNSYGYELENKE